MILDDSIQAFLEADMPVGMKEMMQLLILPERRSERRYKRHVKIKMSGYQRNPGRPASKTAESKGKVLK